MHYLLTGDNITHAQHSFNTSRLLYCWVQL